MIEVTATVRSEIAPTGTLRVGLNMSNFLLTRTDASSGQPAGVAHDLACELARRVKSDKNQPRQIGRAAATMGVAGISVIELQHSGLPSCPGRSMPDKAAQS
jgi:ABC-type amino acid transport substrate-binding protein